MTVCPLTVSLSATPKRNTPGGFDNPRSVSACVPPRHFALSTSLCSFFFVLWLLPNLLADCLQSTLYITFEREVQHFGGFDNLYGVSVAVPQTRFVHYQLHFSADGVHETSYIVHTLSCVDVPFLQKSG